LRFLTSVLVLLGSGIAIVASLSQDLCADKIHLHLCHQMTKGRPREHRQVSVYAQALKRTREILEKKPGRHPKDVVQAEREEAMQKRRKPMFSIRTVYRYLNDLKYLEDVEEKEGLWYPCYRTGKPFSTKAEKDDAWEHSKELVVGLEAILAEGRASHSDALETEAFPGPHLANKFRSGQRDVYDHILTKVGDVNRIRQFAEEHLISGYPLIYESLEKYRKLLVDTRRRLEQNNHPEKVIRFVVDGIATFPTALEDSVKWPWGTDEPIEDDIREALKQKLEAYAELESKIREIEHYVFVREPLDGQCQRCKGIKVIG
jgi:hypothetical protein